MMHARNHDRNVYTLLGSDEVPVTNCGTLELSSSSFGLIPLHHLPHECWLSL